MLEIPSPAEREARRTMPTNPEGHICDPRYYAPGPLADAYIAAWDKWLQENSYRDDWLRGLNHWIVHRHDKKR